MLDSKRVLVVGAHPDDELLGCGGTVARLIAGGAAAHAFVLSGITASRPETADAEGEFAAAAERIGFKTAERGNFPDNRFDQLEFLEIVKTVERVAANVDPDLVLTHDHTDLNIDHRLVHEAVVTAFRPAGRALRLLAFETVSSTEWSGVARPSFQPTCYVDITRHLETKLSALECYQSELRTPPHPRSLEGIEALARLRGFQARVPVAEAFRHIRSVM